MFWDRLGSSQGLLSAVKTPGKATGGPVTPGGGTSQGFRKLILWPPFVLLVLLCDSLFLLFISSLQDEIKERSLKQNATFFFRDRSCIDGLSNEPHSETSL